MRKNQDAVSIFAADSIKNCLKTSNYYFKDYRKRIDSDIFKDIKMSLLFSKVFYVAPLFFYRIIKKAAMLLIYAVEF
jgi:hypothetical protein